jgi:hypothetical protein
MLSRRAIVTMQDEAVQPTEAEMMDVVRTLYADPATLRTMRQWQPNFDSMNLEEKYNLLISYRPEYDVAYRKMKQAQQPVMNIDVPYTEEQYENVMATPLG